MSNKSSQPTSRLLTRQEAAELLGLRPQTLAVWAMDGRYLPVVRVGSRAVRYRSEDIEEFVAQQTIPASPASRRFGRRRPR